MFFNRYNRVPQRGAKGGRNDGMYVVGSDQQIQGETGRLHPLLFQKYSQTIVFGRASALPQNDIEF